MAKKNTSAESEAAEEIIAETSAEETAATDTTAGTETSSSEDVQKTQEEGTMTDDKQSFDILVSQYGVDKAIARGLKAKMNPPADGLVSEAEFVSALKAYAGGTPK